jgi:glycosyltransferase involved in cell wall biosynthesis
MIDPHDEQALVKAIQQVVSDAELRARLSEGGLAQTRKFSWRKTAELTLAVYEKVVKGRSIEGV